MSTKTKTKTTRQRARARRRNTRTRRFLRSQVTELRQGASWIRGEVRSRTTKRRCPHCRGMPWVNDRDWPAHAQGHRIAGPKGKGERIQHVRARGEREWWKSRQRQPQADPGGKFTAPPPRRTPSPHTGGIPSTVKWVDDDGHPIDWKPGDPLPQPKPPAYGEGSNAVRSSWLVGLFAFVSEWFMGPFRARPKRATSTDGKRWKERTHNPGGTPAGGGSPAPAPAPAPAPTTTTPAPPNVVPIRPKEKPVASGPTGGGTGTKPKPSGGTKPKGGGGGGSGGAGGSGDQIAEGAQQWARKVPETLVLARQDAQILSEGLAGIADALLARQNLETDRSVSASCVEPYQEAAQLIRQAADKAQEVYARLVARYKATAEDLARPDTPEPEYLKEGV